MTPLLEIRDLHMTLSLLEGLSRVLNGVSLSVEKGERVAIAGESGCGKSVTVRAIVGLLRRTNLSIEGSQEAGAAVLTSPTTLAWFASSPSGST